MKSAAAASGIVADTSTPVAGSTAASALRLSISGRMRSIWAKSDLIESSFAAV
jgi:hypothetical protein